MKKKEFTLQLACSGKVSHFIPSNSKMRKVSVCVLSVSSPATSHDDSSEDEATVVNYDEDGPILQHTKFPGYTSKNHSTPYQVLLLVGGCCESMTFAASNLSAPV